MLHTNDNGTRSCRGMIRSYWELHFGVRHNKKKGYDSRSECHEAAGSSTSVNNATTRRAVDSRGECQVVLKQVVKRGEEVMTSPEGLSYPKAKRRLERRCTQRSTIVPQRRIYRSRRKGHRCKAMDSRAMGLVAPQYHKGETSMESSIPCSHGGRASVVKGDEEVENAKANSKYQDKVKGQMPRNFIRSVSMGFSSR
ncbi:hypothetical protein GW17_00027161 [Ensete ventricosum]|nr:hypothetical protein GW17_00027161 [Ensete ventricosum]